MKTPPILPRSCRAATFDVYTLYRPRRPRCDWTLLRWSFVVGRASGEPEVVYSGSMLDARDAIPDDATNVFFRGSDDDDAVVESWFQPGTDQWLSRCVGAASVIKYSIVCF